MILSVPVTYHNGDIPIRGVERNRNNIPIVNNDASETSRSPLEVERGEVEEAPNLILNLKLVSPVPLWRDWAVRAK